MSEITQEDLRKKIHKIIKRLISKTWIELMDKPEVVYNENDLSTALDSIMSLLARSNVAIVKEKQEVPPMLPPDIYYHKAQQDMLRAGFVQVERIK